MPKPRISFRNQIAQGRYAIKKEAMRAALIAGENSGDSELQIDDIIAAARQKQLTKQH